MKTSSLLAALRIHADLQLVFHAGREIASSGYHLTEVKRVSYETMDCGAMTHRWQENQFEISVPVVPEPGRAYMTADKFLQIIDRVQAELPLADEANARILASFTGQPAALYDVEQVSTRNGQLRVELTPDKTRCKAAERRLDSATGAGCGSATKTDAAEPASCGCGHAKTETVGAACCA
jgi:hypothetical protein